MRYAYCALRAFVVFACALSCAFICISASPAAAHDIPADVKINAFFKPAGNRLELLVSEFARLEMRRL